MEGQDQPRGDGIYPRGKKLWMSLKLGPGKYHLQSTPFRVGQEIEARAYRNKLQETLDAGAEITAAGGDTTVEAYAKIFLGKRFTKHPENDLSLLKTWVYRPSERCGLRRCGRATSRK